MRYKNIGTAMILGCFLFFIALAAYAYPPLPTEFYGEIYSYDLLGNSNPGQAGKLIVAYDTSDVFCGEFTIATQGYYGVLSCRGDDNSTAADEGADALETIKFTYDGENTSAFGQIDFVSGEYHNVTIISPKIICGDGICMKGIELKGELNITDEILTPHSCNADCGIQTNTTNTTSNTTSNATVPPDNGGTTSGGGGSEGNPDLSKLQNVSMPFDITSCREDWNCTDWSECFANETQFRICTDLNSCNTTKKIPPIFQECIYSGNCYDGIRNGKEQGIDCGGPCYPCPGKENEPNCFDGIKNCQGDSCEEGVDCGGPCQNSCQRPIKTEKPVKICNTPSNLFRIDFLLLYLIIIIFSAAYIIIEKEREQKIKKQKDIKDIEKSKKLVAIRRDIVAFVIFVLLLLSSIMAFYVFFFCSPGFYTFLKFFLPAIILIPVLAFLIMKMLEYNEKERKQKLATLDETHNEHLKKLIAMQDEYLKDVEEELANEIYELGQNNELKSEIEKYPNLKTVYRDMLSLYDSYKEKKSAFGLEKELCDSIKSLEENEQFIELSKKYESVKGIYDRLSLLYKSYEEKQELYNELKEKDALIIEKKERKDK